ncbi:hypothetical protein [Aliisedimentitalea scapharcae]|uniref:hypothetical protein n=1 Tax=Aliisedimentitalea scapharcae TaxID=1524259 RepID=UPI00387319F7
MKPSQIRQLKNQLPWAAASVQGFADQLWQFRQSFDFASYFSKDPKTSPQKSAAMQKMHTGNAVNATLFSLIQGPRIPKSTLEGSSAYRVASSTSLLDFGRA